MISTLSGFALSVAVLQSGFVAGQLPPYTGDFGVGYVTIEVPVANPRNVSNYTIAATGEAAFELETVLFSVYYPASTTNQSTKASPPWIENIALVAQGVAAGGTVDASLVSIGFQSLAGNAVIPAFTDVSLASNSSYPVYMFSHGDTALPEWYSHYLGQIAADGNFVVAINHRDHSNAGSVVEIQGQPSRNVTYLLPSQVSPSLDNETMVSIQREFRLAEVREIIRVLQDVNDGQGERVYQSSSRGEGETLSGWQGHMDFEKLVVGGHSFGATSSFDTLANATTSNYTVHAGLVLDPGKQSGRLPTNISTPLLIADSEAWSAQPFDFYGEPHFDVVAEIAESSLRNSGAGWFMTLLGVSHSSITDAGLIAGETFLSFFDDGAANVTLSPLTAVDKYVEVAIEFLRYIKSGNITDQQILAANVTDPEYTQRPANSSSPEDPLSYWEIHVAPETRTTNASNGTSEGSGSASSAVAASPPTFMLMASGWVALSALMWWDLL